MAKKSKITYTADSIEEKEILDWVLKARPRRSFFGINEEDFWAMFVKIEQYYYDKMEKQKYEYESLIDDKNETIENLLDERYS
jgi:hypothetical protein